ncbi:MAG: hypothetical protein IIB39_07845 [Candidatus Marinimicrobia bacterium]|nr:hypothetical protein [Candidatus Neomarinimicrobiota bacterium]
MKKKKSPRLRTVDKVKPPYLLNNFPKNFGLNLGREIVYLLATKGRPAIAGEEWEEMFSNCIGATWKPSNIGLDDVILGSCAWGAKTVKNINPSKAKKVRLISGRNSPIYSYGESNISIEADPMELGEQILTIWNERVSSLREKFKHLRTIVLVKSNDLSEVVVFEYDTIRYEPELFTWAWNKNKNLEGNDKITNSHKFTWQPHGSQFTIIEKLPSDFLIINIKLPNKLDKDLILDGIGFDNNWIKVSTSNG